MQFVALSMHARQPSQTSVSLNSFPVNSFKDFKSYSTAGVTAAAYVSSLGGIRQ